MQTLENTGVLNICDSFLNESDEEKISRVDAIYDYLTDYLGLENKDEVNESDLTSYLNDIVAGASNNNISDNKLVGTIINLIETHPENLN